MWTPIFSRPSQSTVWDSIQDPIKFEFEPYEPLSFSEMLKKTDNKVLYKIILVFSHLTWEMGEMKQIVRSAGILLKEQNQQQEQQP